MATGGGRRTRLLQSDAAGVAEAAALLAAGGLVAFGTETVYGLGADATSHRAIADLYAAKGRPARNPLILHFADAAGAFATVRPNRLARGLAERFWPGPLTVVLPRDPDCGVVAAASAGLASLAVRVPSGEPVRRLLRAAGRPIAAPSANPSGRVSPSLSRHVLDGLDGRIDAVLECGPCRVGLESTVLDLSGGPPVLLRPGGIDSAALEQALAELGAPAMQHGAADSARPVSPGLAASHYAPRLPVRLDASRAEACEALLAFGPPAAGAGMVWNLSPSGDLGEAAHRLFEGLRSLDAAGARLGLARIAVMPIPEHGLGAAIRDRLHRAAAPR